MAVRLVYAQQDLTTKSNDLVILNNPDYTDSGISIGPGGPFQNLRISYSTPDSTLGKELKMSQESVDKSRNALLSVLKQFA